ncbi:M56 family metallopeptidase [Plantactinospora sonchi]|uniref:M56 family metallopeptidase n=1 Tax=Plantactinospora sonchi TaxID=1544735 RepID=A0ABU7RSX8_9ACTN
MAYVAHFAITALACYLAAQALTGAGRLGAAWTWHSPRVAIICWQAVGLALGLSAIGLPLSVGLAPYGESTGSALRSLGGDLLGGGPLPPGLGVTQLALVGVGFGVAAVLLGSTARSISSTLRAQRRHRDLLTLVARDDPAAPGALVLDHPSAAAYCLPGVRPQVVVSAGTLSLLDRPQLAAVLSHERAHADERHDLVLLPFTALCRALPWARWVRAAHETVGLLVEMRADDKARLQHADGPLAGALLRFATAGSRITPAGALGVADTHLDARVRRLLVAPRPNRLPGVAALVVATILVSLPISLFLR